MAKRAARPAGGFTLVELMVTVAIIAILASIAYPGYTQYVRESKRAACQGELTGLAQSMERSFAATNSYEGLAAGGGNTGAPANYAGKCPDDGGEKAYDVVIKSAGQTSYRIEAQPVGAQKDDECGTLWMNAIGDRGVKNADAGVDADACW